MLDHIYHNILLIRGCYANSHGATFHSDWIDYLFKLFSILHVEHNNQTERERTDMNGCIYDEEVGDYHIDDSVDNTGFGMTRTKYCRIFVS